MELTAIEWEGETGLRGTLRGQAKEIKRNPAGRDWESGEKEQKKVTTGDSRWVWEEEDLI